MGIQKQGVSQCGSYITLRGPLRTVGAHQAFYSGAQAALQRLFWNLEPILVVSPGHGSYIRRGP